MADSDLLPQADLPVPAARFLRERAALEDACAFLSSEDMQAQSMPDASPAKWHLAHTTWFYETFLLSEPRFGYRPFDPAFDFLFNSYYEALGPRHPRPQRGLLTRPSVDEVLAYRRHVTAAVAERLSNLEGPQQAVLELGINHEQQHLELFFTDIKHLLAQNPLRPRYRELPTPEKSAAPELRWIEFEAGVRRIGHAGSGFAFDNEGPNYRVFLEAFALAGRLVTCGEWLAFIADGGYERPELWLSDGWHTCRSQGWNAPLYWERHGDCFKVFTLDGMRAMLESEPVCHVSFYEADAFARWSGARLPTEAEWEVAASACSPDGNLLEAGWLHPVPLADDSHSFAQAFGDAWEWTQSPYAPYPGYRPVSGTLGEYNGKFMCNQMVLRGGSCVTPRSHVRSTYRNFFPPEARWQFTGLRLARSL